MEIAFYIAGAVAAVRHFNGHYTSQSRPCVAVPECVVTGARDAFSICLERVVCGLLEIIIYAGAIMVLFIFVVNAPEPGERDRRAGTQMVEGQVCG